MKSGVRHISGSELSSWLLGINSTKVDIPLAELSDDERVLLEQKVSETPEATGHDEDVQVVERTASGYSKTYNPLPFKNAADFMMFFNEDFDLYPWQIEELMRLSGHTHPLHPDDVQITPSAKEPVLYNLVATNGSGKDATILAGFILYSLACHIRATVIGTSFTESQVRGQTFKHCKYFAERINERMGKQIFEVKDLHIVCVETDSVCRLFVTNEAGRAEGYHANPGRMFAVIINEAKSIDDELFSGFSRYSGWTHWIEVSSAGARSGHFYRRANDPDTIRYPNAMRLGNNYTRVIRLKDCPHLIANDVRVKEIIRDFGENSPIYRSVVNSEFSSEDSDDILIKPSSIEYTDPPHKTYDLPLVAGVDLALGGDETVVSIWQGNYRFAQEAFRESYEPNLHLRLIDIFKRYSLQAEFIAADAGGLGKPIIHRLHDAGWEVNAFNFGGGAKDKRYFLNRGAELWQKLKRLVEDKLIVLPREDERFINQLTDRRFTYTNGKMKLESKAEVRARGGESPDRVDAAVMAWSMIDFDDFYAGLEAEQEKENRQTKLSPLSYEAAQSIIHNRQFNPEQRRGRANIGQPGRVAGLLCSLLNVKIK
jgi:phage terminase large subunit